MIAERHRWLLRDLDTCFDGVALRARGCRVCRTQERGEVRVPLRDVLSHLAHHRREKIDRAPSERPDLLLETLT